MQLNKQCLKLLVLSRKRNFIEPLCWVILFLLIVGFNAIHFWLHEIPLKANPVKSVFVILKFSLLYMFSSVVLVYFNLKVLQKSLLKNVHPHLISISLYLLAVILLSLAFALMLNVMDQYVNLWRFKSDKILNVAINFSLCIISTGLVRMNSLKERARELSRRVKKQTQSQPFEMSVARSHIKIGTRCNHDFVNFEDIVYFMADGKSPIIYTTAGKYYGDFSISDYEKRLPQKEFLRIHRKYIIAKSKVIKRAGNNFVLSDGKGEKIKLRIGESFLQAIEQDPYLGFEPAKLHRAVV